MNINPVVGTASIAERTHSQSLVFKALAKRIATTLRCGLPGIIKAFDPVKQYATVHLAISERLLPSLGQPEMTELPILEDVLVLFPGDANWCLTFPSVVGSECYVCFADMCINAWATHGFKQDQVTGKLYAQGQELQRRHDLSDGFAILAPRSQPNAIPSFSTTSMELRSMDNSTKIQMDKANGIQLKANHLGIAGVIPIAGTTTSTFGLPVNINGTIYYIRLSTTP